MSRRGVVRTHWWIRWPVDRRLRDASRPAARCRAPATRRRVRRRRSTRQGALCPSACRARDHRDVPPPVERRRPRSSRNRERPASRSPRRINRSRARSARSRTTSRLANGPCEENTDCRGPLEWLRDECGAYHSMASRPQDVRSGCAPIRWAWRGHGLGRWATRGHRETSRPRARNRRLAVSIRARPGASRGIHGGSG